MMIITLLMITLLLMCGIFAFQRVEKKGLKVLSLHCVCYFQVLDSIIFSFFFLSFSSWHSSKSKTDIL